MTAARAVRPDLGSGPEPDLEPDLELGCLLACEIGVLVVLTDDGPVRATYGARMLGAIARDRYHAPTPGEWVRVRHWCDGPVTVESALRRPVGPPLAQVLSLRRSPCRTERARRD